MQGLIFKGISRSVIRQDEMIAPHTTIKIGGPADYWFEPYDRHELIEMMKQIRHQNIPWIVLGGGSNVLFSDAGFRGVVIHLGHLNFQAWEILDSDLLVGSGMPLPLLLKRLVENNYGDCEFLYGIPASLGGAIKMNAGSAKEWIGDHVRQIEFVAEDGSLHTIGKEGLRFSYRKFHLQNGIITSARLNFPKVDASVTRVNLEAYAKKRRESQDLMHPSCGCMFMNPDQSQKSAGQMIDECGLKGTAVGGAMVSKIHGNFLVNTGSASSQDVHELMNAVKEAVKKRFDIELHQEMKYIKDRS